MSDTHNVVVILRLVLNARGELMHGEIVDAEGKSQGRFMKWGGLTRTVRAWLESQETQRPEDHNC